MPQPSGADRYVYERHRPEETPPQVLSQVLGVVYRAISTYLIKNTRFTVASGAKAGALTLRTVPAQPEPFASTLLARQPGFSLHAATCCEAKQRDKLEKLCRYITRPAIANERLSTNERGQVIYRFKQPFRDGTTHVVLDPLDFIARLAALVPRPRLNLTRFHGVFAPNCKLREHIVPRRQPTAKAPDKPLAPMTWMQRLKRVFSINIETCPKCGGKLRVIACIEDPDIIAKILEHIRTRDESQPSQPRAPPLRTELPTSVHQDRLF
ncbi:MAG: transposase [Rhodospirillaceae bacterium]|nr:transposase [Rhodospirillaceae bacterium]